MYRTKITLKNSINHRMKTNKYLVLLVILRWVVKYILIDNYNLFFIRI